MSGLRGSMNPTYSLLSWIHSDLKWSKIKGFMDMKLKEVKVNTSKASLA